MLIAGAVLLVLAGVAGYGALKARKSIQRMTLTEMVTAGHLHDLHAATVAAGAAGAFTAMVEVTGVVRPGAHGLLTSSLSNTACVWHRHEVLRKFRDRYTDGKGNRRTRTKHETVSAITSTDSFHVEDATGQVLVHPAGQVDHPHQILDRFVEPKARERQGPEGAGLMAALGAMVGSLAERDDTIGFVHREWALKDGARVYVLAEATDADGSLCLRAPRDGSGMVLSTRTQDELSQAAGQRGMLYAIGAGIGSMAGVVLVVLGLAL